MQFVRPVHKLIALHGADVVPISILGLAASRTTLGHRFLSQGELTITNAESYSTVLEAQGKVIANITARKEKIRAALLDRAGSDLALMPEALLDEVTALVEWPVVYECNFEQEFLSVPQECLINSDRGKGSLFILWRDTLVSHESARSGMPDGAFLLLPAVLGAAAAAHQCLDSPVQPSC